MQLKHQFIAALSVFAVIAAAAVLAYTLGPVDGPPKPQVTTQVVIDHESTPALPSDQDAPKRQ